VKAMEHTNYDKVIGFFSGLFGGFIKFVSVSLLDVTFAIKLIEAGITAFVCGMLGVAGKYAVVWIKKQFTNKK
jgi:hypothetical protein